MNALTFEDTDAAVTAHEDGQCNAVTSDRSHLASLRAGLPNPGDRLILPGTISEEPLAHYLPAVDTHGDDQWFSIVNAVMAILIHAETYGIASDRVPDMPTSDSDIDRLLGFEGPFFQESLGLGHEMARDVIRAVGNYGGIYDRHLGVLGVGLVRENSSNALWDSAPCKDYPKGVRYMHRRCDNGHVPRQLLQPYPAASPKNVTENSAL